MAKQQSNSSRQQRREEERAEKRRLQKRERKGEPKRSYTLTDCMKLGRYANILFVVFIIICVVYYYSFAKKGAISVIFEVVAYTVETTAFALFSVSSVWLDRLVRARGIMKVLLLVYLVVEVTLMLLEFQLLPWTHYNGLSLALTITHAIFSAGVSLSLLMLDPQNKRVQIIVTITTCVILAGMFMGLAGYRVYASVLVNAFAYIFFYSAMLHQLRLEEVDIDCYGDQAKVTNFDSTMFANTPTLMELPERKKKTLGQKAKQMVHKMMVEDEQIILTDKTEKFEYEFGVDEDDDDEYDDYDDYDDDDDDEGFDDDAGSEDDA